VWAKPDQVACALFERSAEGKLRLGQWLASQRGVAQEIGVGLAVVCEAVQRLEALNVVATTHGSGTVVRPFRWIPLTYNPPLFLLAMQHIGVQDLWETRRLTEGQIVRLATQRATEADLAAMREILARAESLPLTYAATQELNGEFQLALAGASQNIVFEDILAPLLDIHLVGMAPRFTTEHCRATWEAHRLIYDAIAAHAVSLVQRAIEHHFQVGPSALAECEPHRPEATSDARRKLV
jgi:DNA-binding FadR family transcriptional regulator